MATKAKVFVVLDSRENRILQLNPKQTTEEVSNFNYPDSTILPNGHSNDNVKRRSFTPWKHF